MDDCFLHLIGLSLRYVVGDILLKEKHFQNESYKERMERKEVRVVAKWEKSIGLSYKTISENDEICYVIKHPLRWAIEEGWSFGSISC